MKFFPGLLSIVVLAAGCASATLSPEGRRVRIASQSFKDCKYLGQVEGSYRGDSVSGGVVGNTNEAALVDLKNQAGKLGADTAEIIGDRAGGHLTAEAYRCQ